MRHTDFSEYPQLKEISKNIYETTTDVDFAPGTDSWDKAYEGYRIRVERPTANEILEIKNLIESQLKDK